MNSDTFADFGALFDQCLELRARLQEAREALSDADFDKAMDGPMSEVLCAAMDIEYWVDKCEEM
jgi:hypothetical protein